MLVSDGDGNAWSPTSGRRLRERSSLPRALQGANGNCSAQHVNLTLDVSQSMNLVGAVSGNTMGNRLVSVISSNVSSLLQWEGSVANSQGVVQTAVQLSMNCGGGNATFDIQVDAPTTDSITPTQQGPPIALLVALIVAAVLLTLLFYVVRRHLCERYRQQGGLCRYLVGGQAELPPQIAVDDAIVNKLDPPEPVGASAEVAPDPSPTSDPSDATELK